MSTSVSIILDTRRMKKRAGTYPVKLRVISKRVTKDYPTIFDLSETDYKKFGAPRISSELSEIRTKLQDIKQAAEHFIKDNYPFDFYEFEIEVIKDNPLFKQKEWKQPEAVISPDEFDYSPFKKRFPIFVEQHPHRTSLSSVYLEYIKKLLQQGRIGNAINYLRSYRSLTVFRGNVRLEEISVSYLYQYEQWMMAKGNSKTTIGIILCPLRAVFNEAIEGGLTKREKHYPFGRRRYQIPGSRNLKKALDVGDLEKVYRYQPEDPLVQRGKDLWFFCYFANGMNVKDMVHLKGKNLEGEYLIFERAKTERTARGSSRPVVVYLTEDLLRIINQYGNKNPKPNDYVFPFMQPGISLLEQFDLVNYIRRIINDSMAKIKEALGIDKKITTIVSRHTFSTHLKRAGASTEFIQEALGHTDKRTTENYLDSFENELKKEFALKLTQFKR